MKTIFKKPNSLTDTVFHYCPGCSHGIVHRLVCEVIDELDISGKTIAVEPVGCAVTAHNYFDFDGARQSTCSGNWYKTFTAGQGCVHISR